MATASPLLPIPRSISSQLQRLRRKLLKWILVRGLGQWLLVMLGVLAVDILVDRLFKMDFAQRLILLALMVVIAIITFVWRLVRPLLNRPNDDALIYKVEDRNPQLNESLISSFQLARQTNLVASGTSAELANATIRHGVAEAEKIDFARALDGAGYRNNWLLLGAAIVLFGLLTTGVAQTTFFRTWFNRNILLADDQWPQSTYLEIVGPTDGRLVIPRGTDRRQLVKVTEDSRMRDVDVSLEVDSPAGKTVHLMKPTGKLDGREHVFIFHNVSSEFRFRARGGDDVTEWVQVELVEPPSIAELNLNALLPEYTGIESSALVGSGPHSVLAGSRLSVSLKANKPLSSCSLLQGEIVHNLDSSGTDNTAFEAMIPGNESELLAGGEYQFELIDESGLASTRPSKFAISISSDKPPKVRADLLGISGLVVPRAMLPVSYNAIDEYGIVKLLFDCNWQAGEENGVAENQSRNRIVDFPALKPVDGTPIREIKDVNVLGLEPLGLQPGTSFRFAVSAVDNCPQPPGVGRSQEFLLRIVTEEELRADLLRREIEQRKAFEQAYNSQQELTSELQAVAAMKPEGTPLPKFDADRETRLINLIRDQKLVGTSVDRIAGRFEEYLVEVKNNRLDEEENEQAPEQTIERRFDERIIQPIRELDATLISLSTRQLDNCRRNVRDATKLAESVNETVAVQQEILEIMKRILDSMFDSENFQEAVNKLLEIKRLEERLKGEIKKRNNPDDIFDVDNTKGIFDDDK
jgi:hypothetical protein